MKEQFPVVVRIRATFKNINLFRNVITSYSIHYTKLYEVDIYTRQFEDQAEREDVAEGVEIIRVPCGGKEFIPKEYMCDVIDDWSAAAAEKIEADGSEYIFINSHYWDAGIAGMKLAEQLNIPHIHTPHSLGRWKKKNLEQDYPESDRNNFV